MSDYHTFKSQEIIVAHIDTWTILLINLLNISHIPYIFHILIFAYFIVEKVHNVCHLINIYKVQSLIKPDIRSRSSLPPKSQS